MSKLRGEDGRTHFGKKLELLVLGRGITEAWLARKLDITRGAVSNWIRGAASPKR
jgi:hypothetical protein